MFLSRHSKAFRDTSGAAHSYSLFYEDENGARVAVSDAGAANVSVGADGFAHLTDAGFSSRLDGIAPVKYFVKDENGRWSEECVTRNRYGLFVGYSAFLTRNRPKRGHYNDANELRNLCVARGQFLSGNAHFRSNGDATTVKIRDEMAFFATQTKPGDVFVFYVATHGGDYDSANEARIATYDGGYRVKELLRDIRGFSSGVAVINIIMSCHSFALTGGVNVIDRINRWLVDCGFGQCLGNVAWVTSCDAQESSYTYLDENHSRFGESFIVDGFLNCYADMRLQGTEYEGGNTDGLITVGELARYAKEFFKGLSDDMPSTVQLENGGLLDRIVLGRRAVSSSLSCPGTPTSPNATQEDTRIDIGWAASDNATSYRIYRYPLDAPGEWKWIGISDGTRFRDETAILTREYGYRIRAVNPVGVSDLSDVAVGSRGTSTILDFLGSFFGTTTASADDYDVMEKAVAPNGFTYGASYVAGLNPTNETEKFMTTITMATNGKPVVSWSPDLNEGGTKNERVYRVLGAKSLSGEVQWDDVTDVADWDAEGYRFFKVQVEMP